MDKEYAGITGVPDFTKAAAELAFGPDSAPIKDGLVICLSLIIDEKVSWYLFKKYI